MLFKKSKQFKLKDAVKISKLINESSLYGLLDHEDQIKMINNELDSEKIISLIEDDERCMQILHK